MVQEMTMMCSALDPYDVSDFMVEQSETPQPEVIVKQFLLTSCEYLDLDPVTVFESHCKKVTL